MLRNYLKIAWRNLLKNKTFSIINIAGLAIGLACFLLITLYVSDELSYDRYNEKADRIYRVESDIRFGGTELKMAVCSDPMGATLKRDYPQVEQYTRLFNQTGSKLVKKGTEFISEDNVIYADSTLFDVFTLPVLYGDAKNALNEPNTVVITASTAQKYFGTTDAVGKSLETNDNTSTVYKVTAVIRDIPANSHFNFDMFFSMDNVSYDWGNYVSHNHYTYIVLKPGADPHELEKQFPALISKYVLPQARQFMEISSMEEFTRAGNRLDYSLMPLKKIHLYSDRMDELSVNGSIQYVYIFSAVAFIILLIACINFMNLSTARSANRAKEVGIRKVLGTGKRSLVAQFLSESTLMVIISLLLALLLTALTLDYFNNISGKKLLFDSFLEPGFLTFLLLLPFAIGLLAGIYPAFFLSSFQPIAVLKGKISKGFRRNNLRSGLVVLQFFISIVLIVGTIVVFRQLSYIQNRKIGFNKDQVLTVHGTSSLGNNVEAFKEEVSRMSGVKASAFSGYLPVDNSARSDNTFSGSPVINSETGFNMQAWNIDYDYVPTLGMEIIKGRNFSRDFPTDSNAIIVNETAARVLGHADPIGKKLYYQDGDMIRSYTIVGVLANFNYESLRKNVAPVCLRLGYNKWETSFRIAAKDTKELLSNIEKKWKAMAPGIPFRYGFLDESFDSMYRSEQRIGKVVFSFATLAIIIACLGLFGLAAYMAEQRTKEIGVRKILGASAGSIVSLLSVDFARLILVAALIAFPFSWFVMSRWLQDFAYRVNISWWIFVLAGVITLFIAVMTVLFQSVRAALSNPIKSLRSE